MNHESNTGRYMAEYPGEAYAAAAEPGVLIPVNGKTGLLAGVLLVGVGLWMLLSAATGLSLAYGVFTALSAYGIAQLLAYLRVPKEKRSGWTLINGTAMTLIALVALIGAQNSPQGMVYMIASLGSVAAFFALLNGIGQCFSYAELHRTDAPGAGWVLIGGMVNLVLGLVLLAEPLFRWFALSGVWGIYLGVSGIAVLAEAFSGRRGLRARG